MVVVVADSPVQGNGSEQRGLLGAQRPAREGEVHLLQGAKERLGLVR